MEVKLIGLDIAKRVFQVCGVDESGARIVSKRLRRAALLGFFAELSPTTVGMEACSTAHYWARELMALGHRVRLLPPGYVRRYVWRNKTDAADAAAICAAMGDARIHDVAVKSVDQQAVLGLHRARELLVRQRTMTGNALRHQLAEFGEIAPQGAAGLTRLRALAAAPRALGLPPALAPALTALLTQWASLDTQIRELEREIVQWHRSNEVSRRLATIPGIGPITASALAASVGDAGRFRTGRQLAAWLGLTPREHSSGLKRRQGAISKRGDAYLRRLLVLGAHAVMRHRRNSDPWLVSLCGRRPAAVAAVALANKMARTAWAVMVREETYRPQPAAA